MDLDCTLKVAVSLSCYEREVVYRTCYAFTDRAFIWLEPGEDGEILVSLTPKASIIDIGQLKGEFGNALVDYALRHQIEQETRNVRDVLVRAAFAGAMPNG